MKPSLILSLSGLLTISATLPVAASEVPTMESAEEEFAEKALEGKKPVATSGLAEIEQHVVIYRKEGEYTPFPTLYLDHEGALITQFSGRAVRSHINTIGQKRHRLRSTDNGLSWKKIPLKEALPPLPGWMSNSGEWVSIRDEGWQHEPASRKEELEAQGYRTREVNEETIAYLTPYYHIKRSSDQGENWTEERHRAPDDLISLYHHFPASTTIKTSTGVLIRALYGRAKGEKLSENLIVRSEDDGKTWQFHRVQPASQSEIGFDEAAIIETADGRLLLMMRPDPLGYLWQSFSDDFGKTWSKPESSGIIGHPPHLLRLPDDRLICTYGYRRNPLGVRAAVSDDNGKTWKTSEEIILRADGKHRPADVGYPTTLLLKDGSLFTIYYITLEDNVTHIAGTKWRLATPQTK